MERLIADAAALSDTVDAQSMSFANIVEAIRVVQTEMGITGTTALEAGRTISGSVGSMKAAWANLVTGFADGNADIETLIKNLVETIAGDGTENNLGVIGNVLPAVERALDGVVQLIAGAAPKIIEIFPGLVEQVVPSLITAATDMVNSVIAVFPDLLNTVVDALIRNAPILITAASGLAQSLIQGIQKNYQILVDGAIDIVKQLVSGISSMLPDVVRAGIDLIFALLDGITSMLNDKEFIQSIVDVVLEIVDILTNPDMLTQLLNAAVVLIVALAEGLIYALPQLLEKVPQIIINLATAIGTFLQPVFEAGVKIVDKIKQGIQNAWIKVVEWFQNLPKNIAYHLGRLIGTIIQFFQELPYKIEQLLINAIGKFTEWFSNMQKKAEENVPKIINNIVDLFEKLPSKIKDIGKKIVEGLWEGLNNTWNWLEDKVGGLFGNLVQGIKDVLEIHSPSRLFRDEIGKMMALGVGEGWDDEFSNVKDDMEKSLTFEDASIGIKASIKKAGVGQSYFGRNIGGVSIVQNIYSEAKTAADLMQEALYQQERAVFLGV